MQTENRDDSPTARPWRRAALWLALLGPFFFASYGFANWWTARLPQVPSLVFAWEKYIPFWDWTILPYMSIDAFYALSLFMCTSRAELDTHARRLLTATLISVGGFLLFPLQCTFARPATSGFNGMLFELLTGFDKPFNQAPSLHVSLLMLLWARYNRHLSGWSRQLLHGWFLLIGISVFTTWQHHVIDGVWGVAVGLLCFYLFPEPATQARNLVSGSAAEVGRNGHQRSAETPAEKRTANVFAIDHQFAVAKPVFFDTQATMPDLAVPAPGLAGRYLLAQRLNAARRYDLARRYLATALLCWATACYLRGWGWWLLWPMLSLLLVALAYARMGVAVFQKQNGQQSRAARWLLAPYRLGSWLASRWFSRHDAARVQVVPGLCIGRAPGQRDWRAPQPAAVLDLSAEFSASRKARGMPYASVPMLDLVAPTLAQLQQAIGALQGLHELHAQMRMPHTVPDVPANAPQSGVRSVLVHCALGYSRSALVAAAWLLHTRQCGTPEQAVACVRAARPQIVLPSPSLLLLELFHLEQGQA